METVRLAMMPLVRMTLLLGCLLLPLLVPAAPAISQQGVPIYELGPGDKLRVTVFGEEDLSGEFEVDGNGRISMPLIGAVDVNRQSLRQAESAIAEKLLDGYLRNPKVSVDVLNYRPFYILGEVNEPGSYPYRAGMTVLNAVVLAGGYTVRADEDDITLHRGTDATSPDDDGVPVGQNTVVLPGDIVRVHERFF